MKHFPPTKQYGFTLLELLVAITIFAIMTFMAYGGLSYVIANSKISEQSLERLHQIQITMLNVERDLSQIVKRNIRDEFGQSVNYLTSGNDIDYIIEFTRNGRRNPAKLLRSHLVRIAYKLEDGNFIRLQWPHLDRVQGVIPNENILLTNVTNLEIRFLDNTREWHSQWPPLSSTGATGATLSAIEYKITLNDWGTVRRLFKASS